MFFIGIFGVDNKEKEIKILNNIVCKNCNISNGGKLIKTFTYFHFFFIPIFKWNEKYYVICSGCNSIFSISNEKGKAIEKGENIEIENEIHADKYPVVALLDNNKKYSGVKFHGVPGGHELNSFILAIYNLGSAGQQISEETLNNIKAIDKKMNIKVCVSLSCHLCPDVVVASQRIAIENKNVEAEMIDISGFKEIKDKFKVMSVPAIIINNEKIYFGAKKIDDIINIIK